jgi:hypothetical protein
MSSRNLMILGAALVVLIVLVVLGQRGQNPTSSAGALFLPSLTAELPNVKRATITAAGNQTVATLERGADSWTVANKSGYPANVGKLRQTLQALSEARILEQKTSNPGLYGELGVEDTAAADAGGVMLTLAVDDNDVSVILGKPEGSKYRYVRRTGEAASYLIDRNPDVSRNVGQWLDASIIDVRSDRVRDVKIEHADGETLMVSKASSDATNYDVADVPEGRELLYPGVANVIGNALRELNLEDVEPASAPAGDENPTVVEFRTFDGLVVRVTGYQRGEERWVALEASADPEAAPAPKTEAEAEAGQASEESANADADAASATPAADPVAEATSINAKVGGWRYRIANYQYEQMTRRMSDLLKPPETKP